VQYCDQIADIEFSVQGAFLNNGHNQKIGKPNNKMCLGVSKPTGLNIIISDGRKP
jgi:hypothetical protein